MIATKIAKIEATMIFKLRIKSKKALSARLKLTETPARERGNGWPPLSGPPATPVSFIKCSFDRISPIFRSNFNPRNRPDIEPGCFLWCQFWFEILNRFSHTKSLISFLLTPDRRRLGVPYWIPATCYLLRLTVSVKFTHRQRPERVCLPANSLARLRAILLYFSRTIAVAFLLGQSRQLPPEFRNRSSALAITSSCSNESFHDKFGDECLNGEILASLAEARVIIEAGRVEYNQRRPHNALSYLTPDQFAAQQPKDKPWASESPRLQCATYPRTCPRHSRSTAAPGRLWISLDATL